MGNGILYNIMTPLMAHLRLCYILLGVKGHFIWYKLGIVSYNFTF